MAPAFACNASVREEPGARGARRWHLLNVGRQRHVYRFEDRFGALSLKISSRLDAGSSVGVAHRYQTQDLMGDDEIIQRDATAI